MQPKFRDSHRHSDRVANVGNVYRRQLALTSRFLAMMEAHARLLCMSLGSSGEDFVWEENEIFLLLKPQQLRDIFATIMML